MLDARAQAAPQHTLTHAARTASDAMRLGGPELAPLAARCASAAPFATRRPVGLRTAPRAGRPTSVTCATCDAHRLSLPYRTSMDGLSPRWPNHAAARAVSPCAVLDPGRSGDSCAALYAAQNVTQTCCPSVTPACTRLVLIGSCVPSSRFSPVGAARLRPWVSSKRATATFASQSTGCVPAPMHTCSTRCLMCTKSRIRCACFICPCSPAAIIDRGSSNSPRVVQK
eukprot:scaffold26646_cov142-Isochrysis_galbana.AAC.4